MSINRKISIKATNNSERFYDVVSIDDKKTYQIDFSPWAEDNHSVSSINWSVESGEASISGQSLTSNVASALITFASSERNLIKIKATTSSEVYVVWLEIKVKDPTFDFTDDYEMRR
jgi:hypothetical protein